MEEYNRLRKKLTIKRQKLNFRRIKHIGEIKKLLCTQQFFYFYCCINMNDIQINTLGYYVDRTFTYMVKFLNLELKARGFDFQHSQFTILMVLSVKEGISQSAITKIVDRDKASVSRNIKYLEERGYIRWSPDGGRKKLIYLTEKGKEIIPILYEISNKDTETTLKGFSVSKRKSIYMILTQMYMNISQYVEN